MTKKKSNSKTKTYSQSNSDTGKNVTTPVSTRNRLKRGINKIISTTGHGIDSIGMPRLFWMSAIILSVLLAKMWKIKEQYITSNSIFDNSVNIISLIIVALIMICTFKKQLFKTAPNQFESIRSRYRDDVRITAVVVIALSVYGGLIELLSGGTDTSLPKSYVAWKSAVHIVSRTEMLRQNGYAIVVFVVLLIMALAFHKKLSKYSLIAYLFVMAQTYSDLGRALLDLDTQVKIKQKVYEQVVQSLQQQNITLIKYPTASIYVNGMFLLLATVIVIYLLVLIYTFIVGEQYVQKEQEKNQ